MATPTRTGSGGTTRNVRRPSTAESAARVRPLVLGSVGVAIAGCAGTATPVVRSHPPAHPSAAPISDADSNAEAYRSAVRQAAVVRPDWVRSLRAVPVDGDSVRVVSWSSAPRRYPKSSTRTSPDGLWVALEGEVQDSCLRFRPGERELRLRQLLGLPPTAEPRVFMQLLVARADLVRPCADPSLAAPTCGTTFPPQPDTAYARWFAANVVSSYQLPNGYPWTRLGFTYNWRPGAAAHGAPYGVTEFVVLPRHYFRVLNHIPTGRYCTAT